MTDAQDRGWGPGWPADRSGDMVVVNVDGADFPGGIHRKLAPLFTLLLEESVRRDYIKLHDGQCWGYANRPIKNSDGTLTDTPSNHSWGIAGDLNAPSNCFGCSSHTIPPAMGSLWEDFGFRWGGNYSGTKDWMHFEFMESPADAERYLERAEGEFGMDERLDKYQDGWDKYRDRYKEAGGEDPGPPPDTMEDAWRKKGWAAARFAASNPHGE
jgi:hypothetical protein